MMYQYVEECAVQRMPHATAASVNADVTAFLGGAPTEYAPVEAVLGYYFLGSSSETVDITVGEGEEAVTTTYAVARWDDYLVKRNGTVEVWKPTAFIEKFTPVSK
jgi:hypothetical protein